MKVYFATLVMCSVLLTTSVQAQSVGEKIGVNAVLGISPSTADFVKQVAVSGIFEVEASKLAVERADEPTKSFAQQMIKDHTKASNELKSAAQGQSAQIPEIMDSLHQSKFEKLKRLNGAEFTEVYRSLQVSAHKEAVSFFERYARGGDNEKLKAWAAKTLPELQHHLDMAQKLEKQTVTN
jgi:putative membrane protein